MKARASSLAEARARRTRVVAVGWGIAWAASMVPVVREGLTRGTSGGVWGAVSAIVSCACLYAACSLSVRRVRQGLTWPSRLSLLLIVIGALTAIGAALGVGPQSLQLVVFLAVVLAFSLPWQAAIGPIAILAGALFLVPRMSPSWSASEGAWIALLGAGGACVFGRYIMEQRRVARVLEQRTHELEINEERNRMARDMHDILGHSLTVIALKTELATRLVDAAPDQAKAELTEVQSLARSALADVRATVNSYRELRPGRRAGARHQRPDLGRHPCRPPADRRDRRSRAARALRLGGARGRHQHRAPRPRLALQGGAERRLH